MSGGETLSGAGDKITIPKLPSDTALMYASQAQKGWQPIRDLVLSSTAKQNMSSIRNMLVTSNLKILDLMNKTTTETERTSNAGVSKMRYIQVALFVSAVLVFGFIVMAQRARYETAKGESEVLDAMLNGLSAGVLALDHKNRIRFHNKAAEEIFALEGISLNGRQISALMTKEHGDIWNLTVSGADKKKLAKLLIGDEIPGMDGLRLATIFEIPSLDELS